MGSPTAPTPSYLFNNSTPGNGADDFWKMRPQDIKACNADPDSKHEKEGDSDVCRYNFST